MPLANRTGDPSLRYLGDGIAEELIYALARVKGLTVTARTSSFAYRDRDVDVREIARDLGVATVLEGSLRRAGDMVRVIVRLVDAHTGFHIWSQSYDRRADDLLGLQAELATEVVQALTPSRQGGALGVGARCVRRRVPRPIGSFSSANALVGASDGNMRAALALYDEALALDPRFARALAARAAARLVLVSHGSVRLAESREAERDARAALSIDPDIASAHVSLAHVLRARGEWLLAEDAHQMALAKSGNDPTVLNGHQAMLSLTGHLRAALDEAETAYRLAPLALPTTMWRALAYSFMGRDEAALRDAAIGRSLGAPGGRRWFWVHSGQSRGAARPLRGRRRSPRPTSTRGGTRCRRRGDHVGLRGGGESGEEARSCRSPPPSCVASCVRRSGRAALAFAAVAEHDRGRPRRGVHSGQSRTRRSRSIRLDRIELGRHLVSVDAAVPPGSALSGVRGTTPSAGLLGGLWAARRLRAGSRQDRVLLTPPAAIMSGAALPPAMRAPASSRA